MIAYLNEKDKAACAEYEAFVESCKLGNFMQSLGWAHVKNNWGHTVLLSKDETGAIRGSMLLLSRRLPLGLSMLYAPRGPVWRAGEDGVFRELLEGAKAHAKKTGAFLLRFDPLILAEDQKEIDLLTGEGFAFTPDMPDYTTTQPRTNYILPDLTSKSEEEMLASFKQKCRYNIKVAKKHGVECVVCGKEKLDDFVRLSRITAERDGFIARDYSYFERMLDAYGDRIRLYLCYYDGKAISGAITSVYAGVASYIYGASDNEYRNVMPNYLMQWEMIRWALEENCRVYDFMGVPNDCIKGDCQNGVYRFKAQFNGKAEAYAGEFDLVLRPLCNRLFLLMQWAHSLPGKLRHRLRKLKSR